MPASACTVRMTVMATMRRGRGAALVLAKVPHHTLDLGRRAGVLDAVSFDGVFDRIDDEVAALVANPAVPAQGTAPRNAGPAAAHLQEKS
jgi:hypothetical protein